MGLSQLPLASGKKHKEVLEALGWVVQSEGNHIVLTHAHYPEVFLSIPNHAEVKKGTLKSILRDAGITDEQYAVFFASRPRKTVDLDASGDGDFRHTNEPDGKIRVHCSICCAEVCLSSEVDEIAALKTSHLGQCAGPI